MISEGSLFPVALRAARPGLLSMSTMCSTARRQEDSGKEDVKPPEKS